MTRFRVEYLVVVETASDFCTSVASLSNLVRAIDGVTLNGNELILDGLRAKYEVQSGDITGGTHRYFHVRVEIEGDDSLDYFVALLKSLRGVLFRVSAQPVQVLWDDVSLHLATRAYPSIYEIENVMRKLITKFMLTSVGLGWTKESVPSEVSESIRLKVTKTGANYLHDVDFIQLSNFLFKEYTTANFRTLAESIRAASDLSELALGDLKQMVPRSNWERYFTPIVNCESDYLRVRWERLYELRNLVAHNRAISTHEFAEINRLVDEVRPQLLDAIEHLDRLHVSEEERSAVAEDAAGNINELYGEFMQSWKILHEQLYELTLAVSSPTEHDRIATFKNNVRGLLNILAKQRRVMSSSLRAEIVELFKFRNVIVGQPDAVFPESKVCGHIEKVRLASSAVAGLLRAH